MEPFRSWLSVFHLKRWLLYLHNILCTRILDSYMQTSCFHTFGISSGCFSLSDTPWSCSHLFSVGYLTADVYDLGILLLLLFLLLSIGITAAVSHGFLFASPHRILSGDISAQTLCGTCNSTSYVLKYYCHYLAVPFDVLLVFFAWLASRAFTISHQEFFYCLTA